MHARRSFCAVHAAVAAVLALAASGCLRGPTGGELGNAQFSYDEGAFGCLAGCPPAEAPMAAGSRLIIHVTNADKLPEFTVASTDESVATFEVIGTAEDDGDEWVSVSARSFAAGDTRLRLLNAATGGEIDRLPL